MIEQVRDAIIKSMDYKISMKVVDDEYGMEAAVVDIIKEVKSIFGDDCFKSRRPKNTVSKIITYKLCKQFLKKSRVASIIGIDHSSAFRYDTDAAFMSISEYLQEDSLKIKEVEDRFGIKIEAILTL